MPASSMRARDLLGDLLVAVDDQRLVLALLDLAVGSSSGAAASRPTRRRWKASGSSVESSARG